MLQILILSALDISLLYFQIHKQVNVLHIISWVVVLLHMPRSWPSYCWLASNGFVEVDEVPNGGIPGASSYSLNSCRLLHFAREG